jgi:hypothetical protein
MHYSLSISSSAHLSNTDSKEAQAHALPIYASVCITNYGPFRGLRGTIRAIEALTEDRDSFFCYYLVELEEGPIHLPVWFSSDEVEAIGPELISA